MQCSSQDLRALTRHWMWAPAVKAKCSLNCWITREFPGVIFKHISPSTRWKRILPAVPLPLPLLTYLFLIMVLAFLLGHHLWAVYDNHYLVWYSPVWWSWGHVLCSLLSRVQLFVIPRTVTQQTLCPWGFPGKNTGVACHFLLQEIFPTQGSTPCLLH